MSAITTLLTTAIVTVGAIKVAKHMRQKLADVENTLDRARQKQADTDKADVLDFSRNPDTGVFEPDRL